MTTLSDFLRDVGAHEMVIHLNEGLHRHVSFCRPDDSRQRFSLNTWPGYLCISGDMGTYVFQRNLDMFAFFQKPDRSVSPSYWEEKLEALDAHLAEGKVQEYQLSLMESAIKAQLVEYFHEEREGMDRHARRALREEVENDLISELSGTYSVDLHQVVCFCAEGHPRLSRMLEDAWEWRVTEHNSHYLWCCHAIVWGIAQFMAATTAAEQ